MKDSIRAWLTEQFGADEDLFAELYDQYAGDMRRTADELMPAYESSDTAKLGEKGHAMKGMALQMGDTELADLCKALQDAGRGNDLPACAALIPQIQSAVAAL